LNYDYTCHCGPIGDPIDELRDKRKEIMKSNNPNMKEEERNFIQSPEFLAAVKKLDEYVVSKKEVEKHPKIYGFKSPDPKKEEVSYLNSKTWIPEPRKFERIELREVDGKSELQGAITCPLTGIEHWAYLRPSELKTITLDQLVLPTSKTSNVEETSSCEKEQEKAPVQREKACSSPAVGECASAQAPNVCQALPLPNLI